MHNLLSSSSPLNSKRRHRSPSAQSKRTVLSRFFARDCRIARKTLVSLSAALLSPPLPRFFAGRSLKYPVSDSAASNLAFATRFYLIAFDLENNQLRVRNCRLSRNQCDISRMIPHVTSLVSPSVLVAKDRFFTRKPVFVFIFTGLRHCNHLRANCMKSGRCSRHSRRLASRNLHCFFLAMYMSALISYCICESDSHDSVKVSDQFESC